MVLSTAVLQVELDGKLKVELDGGALKGTTEGVANFDVDFRSVEGAVAFVELPFARMESVKG
jgi:hypothetical protein